MGAQVHVKPQEPCSCCHIHRLQEVESRWYFYPWLERMAPVPHFHLHPSALWILKIHAGVLFIPADQDLALLRPPQNLRAPQAHRGDLCLRGPGAACAPLCSGCRGPWTPREVPPLAQHPGRQTSIYPTFSTSAPPTPGQSWSSPHWVEDPSTRPKSRSPAAG